MTIEPDPINKGWLYIKQHDGLVVGHFPDEESALEWVRANGLEAWLQTNFSYMKLIKLPNGSYIDPSIIVEITSLPAIIGYSDDVHMPRVRITDKFGMIHLFDSANSQEWIDQFVASI